MFLATLWGVMMVVIIYHVLKGMEKGRYLLHDCKIKNRFLKFVVDFTVTILWLLLFIAVASAVIYGAVCLFIVGLGLIVMAPPLLLIGVILCGGH